jgi:hypothetical protein
MNEPKRRGRPPKAKPELVELPVREMLDPESDIDTFDRPPYTSKALAVAVEDADAANAKRAAEQAAALGYAHGHIRTGLNDIAQAYAERVWAGQSPDVPHDERIARVARALAGQGLSMEGVKLP